MPDLRNPHSLPDLTGLLHEYDRARAYTDDLWRDLTPDEVIWRPNEDSSAIGWHLGHQAHVAHFMVRNLTAAEPSPDPELDAVMDSANPEKFRGALPTVDRLATFRDTVAERVHARIGDIAAGRVGAPNQLAIVATHLLTALINHEYQHDQWIGEVRAENLGHALPSDPASDLLSRVDGYLVLQPYGC
ncbi:DinB family protein [Streptomyces sp. NPDC046821]|uniref:DinB family protein n=1 Tax=Streptomyces sp. NPDC046821 TaxID=3154702 RepID=UPI003405DC52